MAKPVQVQAGASPRSREPSGSPNLAGVGVSGRRESGERGGEEKHPEKTSPLFLVAQYGGGREADEEEND